MSVLTLADRLINPEIVGPEELSELASVHKPNGLLLRYVSTTNQQWRSVG